LILSTFGVAITALSSVFQNVFLLFSGAAMAIKGAFFFVQALVGRGSAFGGNVTGEVLTIVTEGVQGEIESEIEGAMGYEEGNDEEAGEEVFAVFAAGALGLAIGISQGVANSDKRRCIEKGDFTKSVVPRHAKSISSSVTFLKTAHMKSSKNDLATCEIVLVHSSNVTRSRLEVLTTQ